MNVHNNAAVTLPLPLLSAKQGP